MGKAFRTALASYWGKSDSSRCEWSSTPESHLHKGKLVANREVRLYISHTRIRRCLYLELWRHASSRSSGGHASSKHQIRCQIG